jgi:hypothetical protein
MESFERRDFVIWQEVHYDAVRAPLAVRDDVQSAKDQAHSIAWSTDTLLRKHCNRLAWMTFPLQRRQNPPTMRGIVASVFFLADAKNTFHQTASI